MGVRAQFGFSASRRVCLLVACALFAVAAALDHTHVNNLSSKDICATTSYFTNLPPIIGTGHSNFVNRRIAAHNSDVDEYASVYEVHVEVWVLGDGQDCDTATGKHNTIIINTDVSITLQDSSDGGVDVFDVGTNNQIGSKSFTVYNAPSFVAKPTNQGMPDRVRIATLQDVQNPNLDITKVGLSSDSIVELVDGWIKGSDGNYATGTDDDQGFNTHLGIVDNSLPAGFTEDGYDAIPLTADPGQGLQKRSEGDEDLVVPDLQKRAGFTIPNNAQIATIKQLIGMWTDPGLDESTKQKTLLTLGNFRIDQQLNGPVVRNGVKYLQLAVQSGKDLYAAVLVPVGQNSGRIINVSAGGIRKALYQSLQDHTLRAFTPSPKKSWSWVLVVGLSLLLIL